MHGPKPILIFFLSPSKFSVILPNAPNTTGVTVTFFIFHKTFTSTARSRHWASNVNYLTFSLLLIDHYNIWSIVWEPFFCLFCLLVPLFSALYVDLFAEIPVYCSFNMILSRKLRLEIRAKPPNPINVLLKFYKRVIL